MKRSEMIRIMQNAWKTYLLNATSPGHVGTYNGMEHVLRVMEKEGILPPFNASLFGKINAIEGLDYHQWSEEDETK